MVKWWKLESYVKETPVCSVKCTDTFHMPLKESVKVKVKVKGELNDKKYKVWLILISLWVGLSENRLEMKEIDKPNMCLIYGKWYQHVVRYWLLVDISGYHHIIWKHVSGYALLCCGIVLSPARSLLLSRGFLRQRMSVHLCGVRKDPCSVKCIWSGVARTHPKSQFLLVTI